MVDKIPFCFMEISIEILMFSSSQSVTVNKNDKGLMKSLFLI